MSRIVLSLLVDNTAGVLSRVAGLFSRRGYNIESLTVGVTADPRYSRMTVVSLGDHQVLEQIQKQLGKLEDVHDIKELREADARQGEGKCEPADGDQCDFRDFPCVDCRCGKRFCHCYADRRPIQTGRAD